jgi:hypothetical protein
MFAFFPKTPSTDDGITLGSHLFRQGRKREGVHGWLVTLQHASQKRTPIGKIVLGIIFLLRAQCVPISDGQTKCKNHGKKLLWYSNVWHAGS